MELRFEGGFPVGGAGEPGETGVDTVGPVVTTESVPREELLEKAVGWAPVVAATGASAESVPISVGTAKTEAKALSAAGKTRPQPGQQSTVAMEAETQAKKLSEGAESTSIIIRGPCVRKSQKPAEMKGAHRRQHFQWGELDSRDWKNNRDKTNAHRVPLAFREEGANGAAQRPGHPGTGSGSEATAAYFGPVPVVQGGSREDRLGSSCKFAGGPMKSSVYGLSWSSLIIRGPNPVRMPNQNSGQTSSNRRQRRLHVG